MNRNKYPVGNYVPYNPDKELSSAIHGHSLDYSLNKSKYEKIINNPEFHFQNSYITNFDLINHECRGDKLQNSRKFYETIFKETVNKEIQEKHVKDTFISKAIDCERTDVFLRKDLLTEYISRMDIEENFEKKQIFLSSMKKRAFTTKKKKYTDDCKSLHLFKNVFINF